MANPVEWSILEAFRTTIAAATTAGGYNFDLTGTDQVVVGEAPFGPDLLPFVAIAFGGNRTEHGPRLGQYKPTTTVIIGAMAAYTADTPASRTQAVLQLGYDIRRALELARNDPGSTLMALVLDLIVTSEADLVGDEPEMDQQYAKIAITVEVYRQRNAGAA